MSDKIHSLTERFVQDLRTAIAHEILKSLENVVTGVTAPPAQKPKKKKKTDQQTLDYQRAWRLKRKLKAGGQLSPEETKWLKKRK